MTHGGLVDVSGLAQSFGFEFRHDEPAIAAWNLPRAGSPTPLIVYFTRLLWTSLGGDRSDSVAYTKRAEIVLRAAREVVEVQLLRRSAWRAGFTVELEGQRESLWVVLGHSISDGLTIGRGTGDLWAL